VLSITSVNDFSRFLRHFRKSAVYDIRNKQFLNTIIICLAYLHNKRTCDLDAEYNKSGISGGIFEVWCVWWKNDGHKLLIYLGLRKTVGFTMFEKYHNTCLIHIIFFWNTQLISFFSSLFEFRRKWRKNVFL
jgi:hypothetical protein